MIWLGVLLFQHSDLTKMRAFGSARRTRPSAQICHEGVIPGRQRVGGGPWLGAELRAAARSPHGGQHRHEEQQHLHSGIGHLLLLKRFDFSNTSTSASIGNRYSQIAQGCDDFGLIPPLRFPLSFTPFVTTDESEYTRLSDSRIFEIIRGFILAKRCRK